MGIWERLKTIWSLSENKEVKTQTFTKRQMAEFIMPDRVQEILSKKPDAKITDVLK